MPTFIQAALWKTLQHHCRFLFVQGSNLQSYLINQATVYICRPLNPYYLKGSLIKQATVFFYNPLT